jgi:hypothetical protein
MPRHLFTVEYVVEIKGRGLAFVPGLKPVGDEVFRAGDPILLRRPDGTQLKTAISSLELMSPNPNYEVTILLRDLTKNDVPLGTEVWSTSKQ